jgi:TetR/AcrR family transcriptional regulator, cholesterol catabolism regulator
MTVAVAFGTVDAQGGDRAAQLRRVAADLFFTKGFEATTTREIAEALGIRSASIYHHYRNKEEILFEVIRSTMRRLTDGLRETLAREDDPRCRLAGMVANHGVMHALHPCETTLGETELRSLTGVRLDQISKLRDDYAGLVVEVLEQGHDAGAFEILDAHVTAYAVIAQASQVGAWYRPDGRLPLERVIHVYANLALRLARTGDVSTETIDRLAAAARRFHAGAVA